MDTQMLMLYILILINQIISYGVLIYLATRGSEEHSCSKLKPQKVKNGKDRKETIEDKNETSGKYLDYINKFEVEA